MKKSKKTTTKDVEPKDYNKIENLNKTDKIIASKIITKEEFDQIQYRIKTNMATERDKAESIKYKWMHKIGINDLEIPTEIWQQLQNIKRTVKKVTTKQLLEKLTFTPKQKASIELLVNHGYYNTCKIFNLSTLMSIKNINSKDINEYLNDKQTINIKLADVKHRKMQQNNIIKDIINKLGFINSFDFETVINNDQMNDNILKVVNESLFYSSYHKHRLLFNMGKKKKGSIEKRHVIGFLNKLLGNYLLKIESTLIKQSRDHGKKKVKHYVYSLVPQYYVMEILYNWRKDGKINYDDFNILDKHQVENRYDCLREEPTPVCAFD
jgi:hypothetical protein